MRRGDGLNDSSCEVDLTAVRLGITEQMIYDLAIEYWFALE